MSFKSETSEYNNTVPSEKLRYLFEVSKFQMGLFLIFLVHFMKELSPIMHFKQNNFFLGTFKVQKSIYLNFQIEMINNVINLKQNIIILLVRVSTGIRKIIFIVYIHNLIITTWLIALYN